MKKYRFLSALLTVVTLASTLFPFSALAAPAPETTAQHAIVVDASTAYISKAYDMLGVHRIIVVVGAVLTLLVPVMRKLFKKINTSLQVEENGSMGEILLSGDE